MIKPDRRLLLAALSASLLPRGAWAAASGANIAFGPARPFDFNQLANQARQAATKPYQAPSMRAGHLIEAIDFDAVQKIRFRADHDLWPGGPVPAAFFHLSKYSNQPVTLHELEKGQAREIVYNPGYFDYGASGLDPKGLADLGFSGFRLLDAPGKPTDWLAFQGASYFRSSGQDGQYGASARGIAIGTGGAAPEEFPRFTDFWLEQQGEAVTVHALLDGPSVTGAYRFTAARNADKTVVIDVHCQLFFRAAVTTLGIAPLTSMYWYGENERKKAADWRPEIHDSDGLALWTGKGERIWRPLVNPPAVTTNSFLDSGPKGFGLMQRDRDFDHYQDDGAFYDKRPGIWVEPKGDWGAGAVRLVEIPTEDETEDNVVAFWHPQGDIAAGQSRSFDYRLHWQDGEPDYPATVAKVVATRLGRGGFPGQHPWPRDKVKFVVDFQGGPLAGMKQRYDVKPAVSASRGTVDGGYVVKVVGTDRWRALFDLKLDGAAPVDLRLFLTLDGKTLSETWLYQYFP